MTELQRAASLPTYESRQAVEESLGEIVSRGTATGLRMASALNRAGMEKTTRIIEVLEGGTR